MIVRRHVPNNHECLFTALAYLAEGSRHGDCAQRLRKVCADRVASDPEMFSEAVLGMPNVQYQDWIQNSFNWGGENEIGILAAHFDVEVCVVMMEAGFVLPYTLGSKARVYLLYTGQHYDPLVSVPSEDAPVSDEVRQFPAGDQTNDESALECARLHARLAAAKAAERRVKKLKCTGCDAILDDNEAFQAHCMEVEHGDDFAFMCDEVEIVEQGDEAVPDGRIDLTSPDVVAFYNTPDSPFSNLRPCAVDFGGHSFPTAEHLVAAYKFRPAGGAQAAAQAEAAGAADAAAVATAGLALFEQICAAATVQEVEALVKSGDGLERPDWDSVKLDVMTDALRAKFTQHDDLRAELAATGDKSIVMVDSDRHWGMSAAGGIPTGHNHFGKILMQLRGELAGGGAADAEAGASS